MSECVADQASKLPRTATRLVKTPNANLKHSQGIRYGSSLGSSGYNRGRTVNLQTLHESSKLNAVKAILADVVPATDSILKKDTEGLTKQMVGGMIDARGRVVVSRSSGAQISEAIRVGPRTGRWGAKTCRYGAAKFKTLPIGRQQLRLFCARHFSRGYAPHPVRIILGHRMYGSHLRCSAKVVYYTVMETKQPSYIALCDSLNSPTGQPKDCSLLLYGVGHSKLIV